MNNEVELEKIQTQMFSCKMYAVTKQNFV